MKPIRFATGALVVGLGLSVMGSNASLIGAWIGRPIRSALGLSATAASGSSSQSWIWTARDGAPCDGDATIQVISGASAHPGVFCSIADTRGQRLSVSCDSLETGTRTQIVDVVQLREAEAYLRDQQGVRLLDGFRDSASHASYLQASRWSPNYIGSIWLLAMLVSLACIVWHLVKSLRKHS